MIVYTKQKLTHRHRKETGDYQRVEGVGTENAMPPHSSTLAWKIPWMEEPGRLQSMGSLRVRYN